VVRSTGRATRRSARQREVWAMPSSEDSPTPSGQRTPGQPKPRRWLLVLPLVGVLVAAVLVVLSGRDEQPPVAGVAAQAPQTRQGALLQSVRSLQARLRRLPADSAGWASLGSAYVELARITSDPSYYGKANGALDRSLGIRPDGNGPAMVGMGALANARHEFAAARDWALRAQAVQPYSAEVQGVLADALTQLGDDAGATAAVQRMLDLRPNVASFTRASYHFELHGQDADALAAMQRALDSASTRDEFAFCHYHLGELAFHSGRLDEAANHYERGLAETPQDAALLQGRAKVAAARGETEQAISTYQTVVSRAPQAQYLLEYAELLDAAGRRTEAGQQYALIAQQQRLADSQGASDDLTAALIAADHGAKDEALRRAEAEWGRRQSVFVADALAWALHVNGRSAEALPFAERAASLGWRNATFAHHRGMILAALGQTEQAQRFLDEALRINPHFSAWHAPIAKRVLGELRSAR
jgi:tetratricopeptide (TPR) repeat protein